MQSRWVKVVAALAVLLILVVVVTPFLVNADSLRPVVEARLSAALGRKVTMGKLSFSLLSGSLTAQDISIADDPAFGASPFVQAKKLDIGVELMPFLLHRQIHITEFTIESPAIQLIQAQDGRWNFSSMGGSAARPASGQSNLAAFTVGKFDISDGTATVSSIPETGKPLVYSNVDIAMRQFSFSNSFPFQLSASLPGDGSVKLKGSAGPISQTDASDTPFQVSLELKHFDPVAAGILNASKGISGVVDVDAKETSENGTLTGTGTVKAAKLQLAPNGSPAAQPVDIDYASTENLEARTGEISKLLIHTGSVAVQVTGGFNVTPQALVLNLHLSAPQLPVDQVEQLLPVVGVRLPSGSSLRGGTLTAQLAITGPATGTTIAGPVEIDNSMLAGFDLGSKIQGLNPFGGSQGGTKIQTLRTVVNSSDKGTVFTNIYGNLPQIGTATGGGTVSPTDDLNFNMTAILSSSNAVGAVANQAMSAVHGMLGGFFHSSSRPAASGNNGIPLTITGTASDPSIHAHLGGMLR